MEFTDINNTPKDNGHKDNSNFTQSILLDQKRRKLGVLAAQKSLKYIDLRNINVNPDLFNLVNVSRLNQSKTVPVVKVGKKLQLACESDEDKGFIEITKELASKGYEVSYGLCIFEDMQMILDQIQKHQTSKIEYVPQNKINYDETKKSIEAYISDLKLQIKKIEPSTIKEGINNIIFKALQLRSSDIHIQPEENKALLRFRIDGLLKNILEIDKSIYNDILTQIKFVSQLKLNVKNVPQDGRMFIVINDKKVDIRVSLIPTEFGETLVLRLLDTQKQFLELKDLGFSDEHLQIFDSISDLSQGLILVTGPTGSGKTTTLYSLLSRYNVESKKIITLEDPIEYHLQNIVQSQIKESEGYTFKSALESVLRQDPDVVMVGEIREAETANTALQASLTGHVVLSTLHTNSAIESITRLYNMGIEPFLIGPAANCLIAQRLVRKLCDNCKTTKALESGEITEFTNKINKINAKTNLNLSVPKELYESKGCDKCNNSGYNGRIVIAEMIEVDQELSELIVNKASLNQLLGYLDKKGLIYLEEDGLIKTLQGKTTYSEVLRVCK